MSTRVAKLEGLLARVQARASEPRPVRAAESGGEEQALAGGDDLDQPAPMNSIQEIDDLEDVQDLDQVQEIDDVEFDEPGAPESGQVAAQSLGDAMEAAEHQPPLTPPPESGEGMASPHIPQDPGPTMEQLGETISLEEGQPQDFELEEPMLDEPGVVEPESQMEAHIPQSAPPHHALTAPEGAREELDRMRLGDATPIEARVSSRPVLSTNVVNFVTSSREFAPKSFLELLDASLSLK